MTCCNNNANWCHCSPECVTKRENEGCKCYWCDWNKLPWGDWQIKLTERGQEIRVRKSGDYYYSESSKYGLCDNEKLYYIDGM